MDESNKQKKKANFDDGPTLKRFQFFIVASEQRLDIGRTSRTSQSITFN